MFKKFLVSSLIVLSFASTVACGSKSVNTDPTASFQASFLENAQKTYVVLVAVQAFEQEQFIAGKIPIEKHKIFATDLSAALVLTLDAEAIALSVKPAESIPAEVTNIAQAIAKIIDDAQAIVNAGANPLDLQKKVSIADATFKVLQALFAAQQ